MGRLVANAIRVAPLIVDFTDTNSTDSFIHPPDRNGSKLMKKSNEDFKLEWHGSTVVIIPASNVESMAWELIEQAAEIVMGPIKSQESPMVVFDLSEVNYFGSVFLALLLRCHTAVKNRGGELVLCGASKMARELMRITNLDTLWALYDTREEALKAVDNDD